MTDLHNTNFDDVIDTSKPTRPPIHAGEYLKAEFLDEMGLSAYALAKATHIPQSRLSEIINGKRAVTADTALRLSKYFGTTAVFWLNMQAHYDLQMASKALADELASIEPMAV